MMKRPKTKHFKRNKDLITHWLKRLVKRTRPEPPKPLTPEQQLERDMARAKGR